MLGEIRQGFPKVINGIPIHLVRINEVIKRTIRSNENSIGTSGDFDLLLLLLDWTKLLSDCRAVLALVAFKDLLDFQDTLAPELAFITLLVLLGASSHHLSGSTRELWDADLLRGRLLLLLDLNTVIIHRLKECVLPLGAVHVLRLAVFGVLVVVLHLVGTVTSHGRVHRHIHWDLSVLLLVDFPALAMHPRLTHGRDQDAATATSFLSYNDIKY